MSQSMAVSRRDHTDGLARSYTASATYDGVVWVCGQVPRRADGTVPEAIEEQVRVTLDNLHTVLIDAGTSMDNLLKVTVYLANLDEFDAYDAAYCERLSPGPLPPRTTVEVAGFRGDKRIEIDAVAALT